MHKPTEVIPLHFFKTGEKNRNCKCLNTMYYGLYRNHIYNYAIIITNNHIVKLTTD